MKHPLLAMWGALAFIAFAGMVALMLSAPNSEVSASWAQAAGGLAAIVAAYWMGKSQMVAAQRAIDRRAAAVGAAAKSLIVRLYQAVDETCQLIEGRTGEELSMGLPPLAEKFALIQATISSFPLYELDDVLPVGHLQTAQSMAHSSIGLVAMTVELAEDPATLAGCAGMWGRNRQKLRSMLKLQFPDFDR